MEAARRGDRTAFARLYDLYAPMIHGVLLARVPPDDADDLVHEVFLTAMRRLHTLRDSAAMGAWLATIARNRAKDFHRLTRVAAPLPDDLAGPGCHRQEVDEALAMIRALPEPYPELLTMRLVEGMSGLEIAARTGLSHAAVRVNLHRGMKLVRQQLGLENSP